MVFEDRFHAAKILADALENYKDSKDTVILAIPRGALEIGATLSKILGLPLDVVLTKKISAPGNPEFAIGAINREGDLVFRDEEFKGPEWQNYISEQVELLKDKLDKRFLQYHPDGKALNIKNKTVIVVDDGVATGNTLISALELIRKREPKKIIVALPVGPSDTIERLKKYADELICLYEPEMFRAVGQFYKNFDQVDDQEALKLFNEAQR